MGRAGLHHLPAAVPPTGAPAARALGRSAAGRRAQAVCLEDSHHLSGPHPPRCPTGQCVQEPVTAHCAGDHSLSRALTAALSPFASGASGFSLESAAARLPPEDATELVLPTWGGVDTRAVVPTLGGAAGSVFAGGLRARGDADCGSLADGPARGPSALGWPMEVEAVAGEGLWVREQASGTGGSRSPSHDASRSPLASLGVWLQCPPSWGRTGPSREVRQAADTLPALPCVV